MGTVALRAGEAVDLRMRSVDASLELLGDLREFVIVTVHARRRGITEPVWELVERLRIRARVAFDAVEARVDAGLPPVLVEDPRIQKRLARLPVARAGQPEDMVGGVLYLVSDGAAYTTGTTLVMDGGITLGG